jgi:hypothetical protein
LQRPFHAEIGRTASSLRSGCLSRFAFQCSTKMRKTAGRGAAATGRDAFRPVLVVLCGHRATPRQPKTIAETHAEFRTGVHFAAGWNFGEGQVTTSLGEARNTARIWRDACIVITQLWKTRHR